MIDVDDHLTKVNDAPSSWNTIALRCGLDLSGRESSKGMLSARARPMEYHGVRPERQRGSKGNGRTVQTNEYLHIVRYPSCLPVRATYRLHHLLSTKLSRVWDLGWLRINDLTSYRYQLVFDPQGLTNKHDIRAARSQLLVELAKAEPLVAYTIACRLVSPL